MVRFCSPTLYRGVVLGVLLAATTSSGFAESGMTQCKTPEQLLDLPRNLCLALAGGKEMDFCEETTMRVLADAFTKPEETAIPETLGTFAPPVGNPVSAVVTIMPVATPPPPTMPPPTMPPPPTMAPPPTSPPPTATAVPPSPTATRVPPTATYVYTSIPIATATKALVSPIRTTSPIGIKPPVVPRF